MKRISTLVLVLLLTAVFAKAQKKAFLDKTLPVDKRVELLMKEMSLEEKVWQLINRSYYSISSLVDKEGNVNIDSLKRRFPYGLGGFNIDINFDPQMYVKVGNQLQKFSLSMGQGIPMMLVGEGLHGLMSKGATAFPQAISIGCSWDTVLVERMSQVTAKEASARGIRQLLSPVLDLGREPRFGRIEEMYSEDPYLVAELGKAAVNGFQGRGVFPDKNHAIATLKHFAGHGIPEGGRNTAPVNISTYDFLNDHIFPFEQVIKYAKPLSVMPSYNEINGIPNHANKWLINDILRKQLGFSGMITSDQNAIDETYRLHAYLGTAGEAAKLAMENGIDVDIEFQSGTFPELIKQVKSGKVDIKTIDNALRKLLKLKFQLGLFETPFADGAYAVSVTNTPENKKIALEAAEKSMVMLKNENNLLPLDISKIKNLAVIGPMAKGVQFGGYTVEPTVGIDVLTGFTKYGQGKYNVSYAEGCKLAIEPASFWQNYGHTPNSPEDDRRLIAEAVEVAKKSDVVIVAMGESVTFAREGWAEFHLGDRSDITLIGLQNELIEKLLATGKPVIALMFGGRPLAFNYVAKNVPAIFQCYYLGEETGNALANVIFGDVCPSGKLSITIPKSVGELPAYYCRKPTRLRSYINENNAPLYPFGFGLSYTTFSYSELKIDKNVISPNEKATVTVKIKNTGARAGEEIAQLYIRDVLSSGIRPVMELRDFARVSLKAGESKTVTFTITPEKLKFFNFELKKVLEPGDFNIMVGPSTTKYESLVLTVK